MKKNFSQQESVILKFWEDYQIFKKSLDQTRNNQAYVFFDGPPFATGLPHHGHLLISSIKDVLARYFTMKGFFVERRFGWDCHGLPIEHEIDKKLGMSSKEALEKIGMKAYNQECRNIVMRYSEEWEHQIKRLGRWVDFENDYKTLDVSFMESVWWVFHQIWKQGLIYQGTKVLGYSPSLGTVLSNFEANSNYKMTQDPSVKVFFESEEFDFLVWTTTPWTLPSNLGLCVHPDLNYALVQGKRKKPFLILESLASHLGEVIKILPGRSLEGISYKPLYNFFEVDLHSYCKVFCDSFVSETQGTGIVHLAPTYGEEDLRIMKSYNLHLLPYLLDQHGSFLEFTGVLKNLYFKDADKIIIKDLKERNLLHEVSQITHSYPFCPRAQTPLIYLAIPSWYVAVEKIKDELMKNNATISWVPDHMQEGRFGQWLSQAKDWAISRNRLWGTPIPLWYNEEENEYHCIHSKEELEKLTNSTIIDLHRDHVDELIFTLPGKKGLYKRIPEVLDCWFESGSMPFGQNHYPFSGKLSYPADFITEGLDQTRGWFYTLLIIGTILKKESPFKNVIVTGLILAKDGKKMSKSLKNYKPPLDILEEVGADALRLYYLNSPLLKGEELKFQDDGPKEMLKQILIPLENAYSFFTSYAKIDRWIVTYGLASNQPIDKWIVGRLSSLIDLIERELKNYELYKVVKPINEFIEDLTNWYIRFSRKRFWEEGVSQDKIEAYTTLYNVLLSLSKVLAPFVPFFAENMYQELKAFGALKESVHLESFPSSSPVEKNLEESFALMQKVIVLGRTKRLQEKVKIKIPLACLTVTCTQEEKELLIPLENFILEELNVKEIIYSQDESIAFFTITPDIKKLGKRLGNQLQELKDVLKDMTGKDIDHIKKNKYFMFKDEKLLLEEFFIKKELRDYTSSITDGNLVITFDFEMTEDLEEEGILREVISLVQKERKEKKFRLDERIVILFDCPEYIENIILKFSHHFLSQVLAVDVNFGILDDEKKFDLEIKMQLTSVENEIE